MHSILITGAGQGLGAELLQVYMEKRWRVFPLVRKTEDAQKIVRAFPENCHPIVGDVSDDSVSEKISDILERYIVSLDILINNAGIIKKNRGLLNTNPQEIMEHFNVHCIGAYRCTVAVLPYLRKADRPVIINITSRWGSISRTVAGQGGQIYSYQIAKCAQNMLTACLNQELKTSNIRVYAVHPGRLKTAVAPPDAEVSPREAALKLAEWLEQSDNRREFGFYDIIGGTTIGW
jgi:NAD(P)-dependent dehydrogenase (short-subunit alcohol dehydrogenase family)